MKRQLVYILLIAAFALSINAQNKTRIGQTEIVNFPVNGEVKIEVVETVDKPTITDISQSLRMNKSFGGPDKSIQIKNFQLRAEAYCKLGKKTEANADEQKLIALGEKVVNPCK